MTTFAQNLLPLAPRPTYALPALRDALILVLLAAAGGSCGGTDEWSLRRRLREQKAEFNHLRRFDAARARGHLRRAACILAVLSAS